MRKKAHPVGADKAHKWACLTAIVRQNHMKISARINEKEIKSPILRLLFVLIGVVVTVALLLFVALPLLGAGVALLAVGVCILITAVPIVSLFGRKSPPNTSISNERIH